MKNRELKRAMTKPPLEFGVHPRTRVLPSRGCTFEQGTDFGCVGWWSLSTTASASASHGRRSGIPSPCASDKVHGLASVGICDFRIGALLQQVADEICPARLYRHVKGGHAFVCRG